MKEKFGGKIVFIIALIISIVLSGSLFFLFKKDKVNVIIATTTAYENTPATSNMFTVIEMDRQYVPDDYINGAYVGE